MLTTNFSNSFAKNILLYMSSRLSKIPNTYVMSRTVYFGRICTSLAVFLSFYSKSIVGSLCNFGRISSALLCEQQDQCFYSFRGKYLLSQNAMVKWSNNSAHKTISESYFLKCGIAEHKKFLHLEFVSTERVMRKSTNFFLKALKKLIGLRGELIERAHCCTIIVEGFSFFRQGLLIKVGALTEVLR